MASVMAKRPRAANHHKESKIRSDIALVTYESCEPSFHSCVCDDITEHVSNLGDFNTTLHTYVCALGAAWRDSDMQRYHDGHELVPREKCRKTLVEQTSELKNIECDTMVILCHGAGGTAADIPYMCFFDKRDDIPFSTNDSCAENALMVYACESEKGRHYGPFEAVIMCEVVDRTTLCVLMCCYAGDIVGAHLFSPNKKKRRDYDHEYFYFDGGEISGSSMEILISWIINLVDGQQSYTSNIVSVLWRRAIVRIMETVKLFGDDNQRFFDFLCALGLASNIDDDTKKMQLPWRHATPEKTDAFRVGGHKLVWVKSQAIKKLLPEFKTLTLVTVHAEPFLIEELTPASSDDILLSSETGIDTFLKEFKDRQKGSGSEQKRPSEKQNESEVGVTVRDPQLVALLHRLEDIACGEAKLDTRQLFDVLERVQCAEERICVSKLLAGILKDAREDKEGTRDGSAKTMAAVRALVVKSIEPLVEAPFDRDAVLEFANLSGPMKYYWVHMFELWRLYERQQLARSSPATDAHNARRRRREMLLEFYYLDLAQQKMLVDDWIVERTGRQRQRAAAELETCLARKTLLKIKTDMLAMVANIDFVLRDGLLPHKWQGAFHGI